MCRLVPDNHCGLTIPAAPQDPSVSAYTGKHGHSVSKLLRLQMGRCMHCPSVLPQPYFVPSFFAIWQCLDPISNRLHQCCIEMALPCQAIAGSGGLCPQGNGVPAAGAWGSGGNGGAWGSGAPVVATIQADADSGVSMGLDRATGQQERSLVHVWRPTHDADISESGVRVERPGSCTAGSLVDSCIHCV